MYFKKLELIGFKSFCDKTVLHFEPGITAVVGPNGCGKSNIFDSIRWVLGEQSAKSLRGSEMQDVIFNGTDSKEGVGLAEVSLTFDNEKRFFNIDHPEVSITRRLFRSGESEYLLNKTPVRLKDILDLLMGTGIGAESYSIVAQGKIDMVLSSRPEDRRLVFDEAAGITKYKSQKRETLRRLEETEQNLLRVNDIITEVKRQIGSLERQANKARKYKEVFEELKSREISLSVLEKQGLFKQKEEIISQLKELELNEAALLSAIRQQESSVAGRQAELKQQEENSIAIRNQILSLENLIVRNNEHVSYNKEKVVELTQNLEHLENQIGQVRNRIILDEEKLAQVKDAYGNVKKNIEAKSLVLAEKENQINILASSIKNSLETIANSKKQIMDFANKIANAKNEISDFSAKEQIYLARKKRLEIEKAKVFEEKSVTEESLTVVTQEVESLKKVVESINLKTSGIKNDLEQEGLVLTNINADILGVERQRLALESQKEFLEKLKSKYEDIGEALNAVIYLDKLPSENMSGLVVKVRDQVNLSDEDKVILKPANFKLSGEAKPIELDTQKIDEKISHLQDKLGVLKNEKAAKEARVEELNNAILLLQQDLRNQEIALANKDTSRLTILEQFNKIEEEEDIIVMELQDVGNEISVLEKNIEVSQSRLSELNKEQHQIEGLILQEEDNISENSGLREEVLVVITQTKTELENLNKSIISDESTLRILEGTYKQDLESLANIEKQICDGGAKKESLALEIADAETKVIRFNKEIEEQNNLLKEAEAKYRQDTEGASGMLGKIESDRAELDTIKNKLYELQMRDKDIDYKYRSIKDRLLQAYKIDLESLDNTATPEDMNTVSQEIEKLKEKLDSYGTVNLVAIEEYDELKKRYDFLVHQQNDLLSAKESLHQAILKINRTTKQMFLETFEKVREEFRNYFRLLFNGGDAQVFLVDEQDPLESGIEIICRPPGKKLQNVLLLSGGEKSLSAIALIFAIFKVKPSPFCILDEIDAALDEANVTRFSGMLQEFTKTSQFIVITHNKKTIINANVMYGITMQESGVSKIVSVKFAKQEAAPVPDPVPEPEPV
ncbi:MAG: AAA family ATPase [Candidatus Omnitrophota bacterium]